MTLLQIPPDLVSLLRRDLLVELSSAADLLCQLAAPGYIADERAYHRAGWQVDAARAVLAQIGPKAPVIEPVGSLRVDEYALLVLKLARARSRRVAQEAEDTIHEGRRPADRPEPIDQFAQELSRTIARQRSSLSRLEDLPNA
jgi:hypothetical protein